MSVKKSAEKVLKGTKKVFAYVTDSLEKFDRNQRYKVPAYCYNCGYRGDVFVLKGLTVKEALSEMRCPNCQTRCLYELIKRPKLRKQKNSYSFY